MFADYFIYNYKKLTKAVFDLERNSMDQLYIRSFPYPAPFDEQQYTLDDSMYGLNPVRQGEESIMISPREEYLKHYPF